MKYRSEIDGLRALAVVPVILFHAGFKAFSGGFVGVDVFFVISGYLITTILLNDLEAGKFSIVHFYERRARRILPALFLVMFACLPFAWFWLLPQDMKSFSQSLVAVSVFASNILFWRTSGYFDTATELKPLIHTWSLSVEEQYYVLFPLFLFFAWRLGKRWTVGILAVVALISLSLAQWGAYTKPAFTFFMLPPRAWELLIGAFVAFYYSEHNIKKHKYWVSELGSLLGFVLISYATFAFSEKTPFPSLYALVPTIGAALIIVFATNKTLIGKLLSTKPFLWVGLISYSAYLWHQPLFAFARHRSLEEPSQALLAALTVSTLPLAYLTWRFVERPFRNKHCFSRLSIFVLSIACSVFFCAIGFAGHINNGFAKPIILHTPQTRKITNENFILLGDSHAEHLIGGLSSLTTGLVSNKTSGGCIPLRNVDRYDSRFIPGDCARTMNEFLDQIIKNDADATLILSSMGPVYLEGTPFAGKDKARVSGLGVELITDRSIKDRWRVYEIGLRSTLYELSKLKNTRVVFALDVPELGIEYGCATTGKELKIANLELTDLTRQTSIDKCYITKASYNARAARYRELVRNIVYDYPKIKLYDPADYFCDEVKCKGFDLTYGFLYRDVDHLSESGSIFYAINFFKALQQ